MNFWTNTLCYTLIMENKLMSAMQSGKLSDAMKNTINNRITFR